MEIQEERKGHFRFEDLAVWQAGRDLAVSMHHLAEKLDEKRYWRYAEQLRAAALSVPNNIAEGAGSVYQKGVSVISEYCPKISFRDCIHAPCV